MPGDVGVWQLRSDLLLGGKVLRANLERTGYAWPQWPRLCHDVLVEESDENEATKWLARLTGNPGLELEAELARIDGLARNLCGSARLAWRARAEPAPTADAPWPPPAQSLQDALLLEALREGQQVPRRLQACGKPLRLNLLYARPGQSGGGVVRFELWRLPLPQLRSGSSKPVFVPSPAACFLWLGKGWKQAQEHAAALVAGLLRDGTPPCAWVWDLYPIAAEGQPALPLWQLLGESAGAAQALGAARLMVESIADPKLRASLRLVDFSRIAVTARLDDVAGALARVEDTTYKVAALQGLQGGSVQPTHAFFGPHQGQEPPTDKRLTACECKDFPKLVQQAAMHTGGRLSEDEAALHDLLLLDGPVTDRSLVRRVAGTRPASLRGWLVHRWADWATDRGQDALTDPERLDQHFVNLQLRTTRPRRRGEGFDQAREVDERFDSLARLLQRHPQVPLWLIEAVPGAGKTTLLAAFEMHAARDALRGLARGDAVGEICVWLPLRGHPIDRSRAPPTPQAMWQARYPQMPELLKLAPQGSRLRLIFDGVNEMGAAGPGARETPVASSPATDRLARVQTALDRLTQWLDDNAGTLAPAIFSVRSAELTFHLSLGGFAARQVRLSPFSPGQMRDFCRSRLGARLGARLMRSILSDPEVARLCALPINLAFQTLLMPHLGRPAADRAELFCGVTWFRLVREFGRGTLDAPGLLDEPDRRALNACRQGADIRLPTDLRSLPDRGLLLRSLDGLAMAMQRKHRDRAVEMPERHLRRDTRIADAGLRDAFVAAAEAMDAVRLAPLDRTLRFAHQLLQEFHAARSIDRLAAGSLPDFGAPVLEPIEQTYAALGQDEPLPAPGVSTWEETAKLALLLAQRPEPLLRRLMAQNPALAGRAVAARLKSGRIEGPPAHLLDKLRAKLVQRSRDAGVDLRQRIEAGQALGELGGDPRYRRGDSASGPYLMPLEWVTVPKGTYVIGSPDGEGSESEHPQLEVELSAFSVAWAPVTNAEFALFMQAGGYEAEQWWPEGAARNWWRNEKPREPGSWTDTRFNNGAQPVVGVSLYEAQAYALWLASCSGLPLRLPLEAEWEAAARGKAGRRWSYGDDEPEPWRFNHGATRLGRTSPVGVFPDSDTPEGLADMSGNCSEWTLSAYDSRGHSADALRAVAADDVGVPRARRGGGWGGVPVRCRAAFRGGGHPGGRGNFLGFRLVCAAPFPGPGP